ncbi:hypothetical protein P2318_09630 [Myxococcaceae bacterium GXIMD 01537]
MTSIKSRPGVSEPKVASKPPEPPKPPPQAKVQPQAVRDGFERGARPQSLLTGGLPQSAALPSAGTQGLQAFRMGSASTSTLASAPLAQRGLIMGPPAPLTPEEQQAANEILGSGDPRELDAWLARNPDADKQAAMMDYLFQFPEAMGVMLSGYMPPDAQARIGTALNTAFTNGQVTAEDIAISAEVAGNSTTYGEIVGQTGNPQLISTFVDAVLRPTGQGDDGRDPIRAQSAAFALAGLPPAELDTYLNTHADTVTSILSTMNGNMEGSTQQALGALLTSAARIAPAADGSLSGGVVDLFLNSVPLLGDNPTSVQGATEFFMAHGDALLHDPRISDSTGFLTPAGESALNEFWARTMFQGSDYANKEQFTQWVSTWLGGMTSELSANPRGAEVTDDQRADAVRLGSVVGTLENGFETAIERLNKRNEAIEGMVDLVFGLKQFIPSMDFPGAGKAVDVTVDTVRDWVVGWLTEDPATARDSLPFHDQFANDLDNQDLRESYAIGRGETHDNDNVGIR